MKQFKTLAIITTSLLLTACASNIKGVFRSHADDYQQQAGSVHKIVVPANLSKDKTIAYYPINQPKPEHAAASKVPPGFYPGQVIAQHDAAKKQQKLSAKESAPVVAAITNGELPLDLSMQTAWAKVADALQSSGYQILDQDESMHSY